MRTLYHFDDIKKYLDVHKNVLNNLAILDRFFLDLEMLKPIFCSVALLGIHFTKPYLMVLMNKNTNYDMLLSLFPVFHNDLRKAVDRSFLQTEHKVVNFVNEEQFKSSLPSLCLRKHVESVAVEFEDEVLKLLQIMIPRLADGFQKQRGSIFGFGETSSNDTGTILKVSTV